MKKKAAVFLDYDILIRHFVHSGVFKELESAYDVTYVFSTSTASPKRSIHIDVHGLGLRRVVEIDIPRARMGSWNPLYNITLLHYQRGHENYAARKELMIALYGARCVRRWWLKALPGVYPLVRRHVLRSMGTYGPLERLLDDLRPDIIIHPSVLVGFFINELIPLTAKRRMPFVVLMNSWDNPTSKAMMTGVPDRLVVWGELSKKYSIELLRMPADRIECFGAAQFQIYREPPAESMDRIKLEFGVPLDKRIVLYGGASKGAYETKYLRILEEGIENGSIPDCHVLYRPHPWRGGLAEGETNFFDLRWKHISMDPHLEPYYRQQAVKETGAMDMAEYGVLHRLLHMVDAVISPLSTILLEATIVGKPVLMFFPRRDLAHKTSMGMRVSLGLMHFADFFGADGVNVCMDEQEFFTSCCALLEQARDATVAERLQVHARRFVVMDGPTYGERLLELANEMTGEGASAGSSPGRERGA